MTQPNLFDVPEQLSPRLAWMKKHNVITFHLTPKDPDHVWLADFYEDDDLDIDNPAAYFASETASNGERYIGTGDTEDEAIVELCKKRRVKLWNEEQP